MYQVSQVVVHMHTRILCPMGHSRADGLKNGISTRLSRDMVVVSDISNIKRMLLKQASMSRFQIMIFSFSFATVKRMSRRENHYVPISDNDIFFFICDSKTYAPKRKSLSADAIIEKEINCFLLSHRQIMIFFPGHTFYCHK